MAENALAVRHACMAQNTDHIVSVSCAAELKNVIMKHPPAAGARRSRSRELAVRVVIYIYIYIDLDVQKELKRFTGRVVMTFMILLEACMMRKKQKRNKKDRAI
jgi:hypothetical protein